jgi:hypothetical protein
MNHPPCPTCRSGCHCPADAPGCGHLGCYGTGPQDCPGVTAEADRWTALLAQRRRDYDRQRLLRARANARLTALVAGQPAWMTPR